MGRPSLNMKVYHFRFDPEVIARVDAITGSHRRPQFVRDAVERALKEAEAAHSSDKPSQD